MNAVSPSPGSADEPHDGDTALTVMHPLEKPMNANTLDRAVLHVTLIAGLIALVLLPW